MIVDELVRHPGSWLSMEQGTGVVISSRVRLARNAAGFRFPDWAEDKEIGKLYGKLCDAIRRLDSMESPVFFDMGSLRGVDKDVLQERHLISIELAGKGEGSGLAVAPDERVAIMINEEDHLRMQAMSPGFDLWAAWNKVDRVDSELQQHIDYAFAPRLGYLTACPSNLGTGLRAGVMMHLSGLRLTEELDQVIKGLDRLGITVRGLFGEGTEAYGNMFQLSNRFTLGDSEVGIIEHMEQVVSEVARHEENARTRLMEKRKSHLIDRISRALGTLLYARVLSSGETVELLSALRLGVEMQLVRNLAITRINEILLMTQPGHLQKTAGRILKSAERDEVRAQLVKANVRQAKISR